MRTTTTTLFWPPWPPIWKLESPVIPSSLALSSPGASVASPPPLALDLHDLKILNPISWILVSFAENPLGLIPISSCTGSFTSFSSASHLLFLGFGLFFFFSSRNLWWVGFGFWVWEIGNFLWFFLGFWKQGIRVFWGFEGLKRGFGALIIFFLGRGELGNLLLGIFGFWWNLW